MQKVTAGLALKGLSTVSLLGKPGESKSGAMVLEDAINYPVVRLSNHGLVTL
jgi:hypothetical protein